MTIDNSGSHQYRVAWRGGDVNPIIKMQYELIKVDDNGQEVRSEAGYANFVGRAEGVEFIAITPFSGRLPESQTITFQLTDSTHTVVAEQTLPFVKPAQLPTVNQFEKSGTAVVWDVSTPTIGSQVQVHINRTTGREQIIYMPLSGSRVVSGDYESIELIVNGFVLGTLE